MEKNGRYGTVVLLSHVHGDYMQQPTSGFRVKKKSYKDELNIINFKTKYFIVKGNYRKIIGTMN